MTLADLHDPRTSPTRSPRKLERRLEQNASPCRKTAPYAAKRPKPGR